MDTADKAEIRTEFDNRAYVPGESIRGTVSWQVAEMPRDPVVLRLFYYTEGKGTQDVGIISEKSFEAPGSSGKQPYEFELPEGPYSFSGKLISLIWALELMVGNKGPVERLVFTLSPTSEEIDLYRHAHENMPEYGMINLGKSRRRRGLG